MITDELARPWLIARLPGPMRILSHAPWGAGFVTGDTIVWREVRNSDLSPDFPVEAWFQTEMARAPVRAQVGMMTSRDVGSRVLALAQVEGIRAAALSRWGCPMPRRWGAACPGTAPTGPPTGR